MEKNIIKLFNQFFTSPDYSALREELTQEINFQKIKLGGLILKVLRQQLGLSQKSFGEKLNKKQNTILKYEIGALKINLKTWQDIITTFNIDYDVFFSAIEKAKSETFPVGSFAIEKIGNIILSQLPKEYSGSQECSDIIFPLLLDLADEKIDEHAKELLNKIYPFVKTDVQEAQVENKPNTILEEIRNKIELITDEERKKIEKVKLKKIEKDIENYTIFLLKQNNFL